jgi:hypothetical protein
MLTDQNEITQGILRELVLQISPLFSSVAKKCIPLIRDIVKNAITDSPTYRQLLPGGVLYNQIGNPDIEAALIEIVEIIVKNIEFNVVLPHITGDQISGEFVINILRSDFSDVLAASGAKYTYTSKQSGTRTIEWLDWLLRKGQGVTIISNFHYIAKTSKFSRTNFGIMGKGGTWAVPTDYGGSESDNWLTKAMASIETTLENTIEREFSTAFG